MFAHPLLHLPSQLNVMIFMYLALGAFLIGGGTIMATQSFEEESVSPTPTSEASATQLVRPRMPAAA